MDLDIATLVATGKHGVMTLADAAAQGVGRFEVARLVRRGKLVRLVDGTFTDAERWHACTPEGRHALRAVAVARTVRTAVAISHISAAAILGLPLVRPPGERVHVSRLTEGAGRTRGAYTLHTTYGDSSVLVTRKPSVVVPALAALGVAQVHGFTAGVVALDAALQSAMTTEDECRRWLDGMPHRPGVSLLRRALAAADGRSESPLETRARLVVRALGFDVALQVRLYNELGEFVARVDMLAAELGVVIEVDGAVKYTRPDGSASVESVISEKHREGALRDLGYGVVRLDHRSMEDPEQVRQRIYAAASRASPSLRRAVAGTASQLRAPAAR